MAMTKLRVKKGFHLFDDLEIGSKFISESKYKPKCSPEFVKTSKRKAKLIENPEITARFKGSEKVRWYYKKPKLKPKREFHTFGELKIGSKFTCRSKYTPKCPPEYIKISKHKAELIKNSEITATFDVKDDVRWYYEFCRDEMTINELNPPSATTLRHSHDDIFYKRELHVTDIVNNMIENPAEIYIVYNKSDYSAIQRSIRRKVSHEHPCTVKILASISNGDKFDKKAIAYLPAHVPKNSRPLDSIYDWSPEKNLGRHGSKSKLVRKLAEKIGEEVVLEDVSEEQITKLELCARSLYPDLNLSVRYSNKKDHYVVKMLKN